MNRPVPPVWRSILYVPGNVPKFIDKARERGADCVLVDLEDSVQPAQKPEARAMLPETMKKVARGGADVAVRINRPLRLAIPDIEAAVRPGLSALFAAHDIERTYIALVRGTLLPARGRIVSNLGRSTGDRKKMAVLNHGGREAITDYAVEQVFGASPQKGSRPADPPMASRIACTLHTGRTHQIRVHMASRGAPLLGDPVYGSGSPANPVRAAITAAGLTRQALHAAILGFVHPVTGEALRFQTEPPADMRALQEILATL